MDMQQIAELKLKMQSAVTSGDHVLSDNLLKGLLCTLANDLPDHNVSFAIGEFTAIHDRWQNAAPVNVDADVQAIREVYEAARAERLESQGVIPSTSQGYRRRLELEAEAASEYIARLQARVDAQAVVIGETTWLLGDMQAFAEVCVEHLDLEGVGETAKESFAGRARQSQARIDANRQFAAPQPPASAAQAADGGAA